MKRFVLSSFCLFAAACTHSVHQVQTSDFAGYRPLDAGRIVKGQAEQFVILGFVGQTDFVNQAYARLKAACPSGTVSGITTQLSTDHGFFSWTNRALMQGQCVSMR